MKRIPLTKGQFALVDNEDYEWLIQWKWQAKKDSSTYYACRTEPRTKPNDKKKYISMHRAILNVPREMETDHRNRNGLDNRKENIRACTHAQNQHNLKARAGSVSEYKGVDRHCGKWRARIVENSKSIYLGSYESEIEAARAYDAEAKILHGEFACTNL